MLGFLGLFVAGALSLEAGMHLELPCGPTKGCATVAADPSSKLFGAIPIAYIGLVGYLILTGLAVMRSMKPVEQWRKSATLGYLFAAFGTITSLYLQWYSIFQIHATCLWCLTSAITMIATLVVYALLAQDLENLPTAVPAEAEETAPALTPRRDFRLIGMAAVVVVVGLIAMAFSMRGGAGDSATGAATVADLIPPGAHTLGSDTAPVKIVEFADLCCPSCQKHGPEVKDFVVRHPGKIPACLPQLPSVAATSAGIECGVDCGVRGRR